MAREAGVYDILASFRQEVNKMLKQLWRDEAGVTTVEYALLLALVSIAAITAWTVLGQRVSNTVTSVNSVLPGGGGE